jgi:hypothetical protein
MSLGFKTTLEGEYCLTITKPDGTQVTTGWFKNLILNQGLDRLGTTIYDNLGVVRCCRLGTGTSTPTPAQTQLDSQLASVIGSKDGQSAVGQGSPDYSTIVTWGYGFPQGSVVGNITEVGTGWNETGDTLFSRALITDSGGAPIAITVTAIDQLSVYYRIRFYPSLTDSTGSVTLGSTLYNYTARVANVDSPLPAYILETAGDGFSLLALDGESFGTGATLGPITGTMTGSNRTYGQDFIKSPGPYAPGTYYRDTTLTWPVGAGIVSGGIYGITLHISYGNQFQILFDASIPKTNTNQLTLTFRYSWSR